MARVKQIAVSGLCLRAGAFALVVRGCGGSPSGWFREWDNIGMVGPIAIGP